MKCNKYKTILKASLLLSLASCGISPANPANTKNGAAISIRDKEANSFVTALLNTGVPRKLSDLYNAYVIANEINCHIDSSGAAAITCSVRQFGGDLSASGSDAATLAYILSAHGAQKPSTSSSDISLSVRNIRCSFSLVGPASRTTCTFTTN
jgi:hypothetical protein